LKSTLKNPWNIARVVVSWKPTQKQGSDMTKKRTRTARALPATAQPPALALEPRILDAFVARLARRGVVPIPRVAKLVYLALVSRFLDRPVCLLIKGPSSAGKSHIVSSALPFVRDAAYFTLTAMSERALAYSRESFVHRVLVIYEAAGLSGPMALYLTRSLVSEDRIDYHTVTQTSKGLQGMRIVKEGPTGLICTTTRVRLHHENETRMFSVTLSDSNRHTAAILEAQAASGREKVSLSDWHDLDDYMQAAEHRVAIPYAKTLARQIPPVSVRLRRDFPAVLSLIRAHALLHQAQRSRDRRGRVLADYRDYRQVRRLIERVLGEGVGKTVSNRVRNTVRAVPKNQDRHFDGQVTNGDVARKLGIDESGASRRVREAVSLGYLENLQTRPYGPARLVRGNPLPGEFRVLPTTKELKAAVEAGSK
jgi:hypothetical protein